MRELSLVNSRIDKRYDVHARLGRGSYAEIFVAKDTLASPQSPHNLVVIKALNVFLQEEVDHDLERTLVENFQNEAIALDRVRHPNVISRLGHGTARDMTGLLFHYLILEYLEGGDLQKAIRERKFTVKALLKYIEQVCAGLGFAHEKGVIHRDIKPHNLLLTKDLSTAKIADFGVARLNHADNPITRVGTNIYAAPEHSPLSVATASGSTLTPAADIYSLAKTIYTLVTGEAPRYFANEPITELPLSARNEPWARDLLSALTKATQTDPNERFQTVNELWTALSDFRLSVGSDETLTHVRGVTASRPQPHLSHGFTPRAPQSPRFNTSKELKLRLPLIESRRMTVDIGTEAPLVPAPDAQASQIEGFDTVKVPYEQNVAKRRNNKRYLPRLAAVAIFLTVLVGGLYFTQQYVRSAFSGISLPFMARTGTATTDINLRPSPDLDNDPIGVVTKNSKLRIVKTQNNWYQVDVVEQGRERANAPVLTRGWLNGKYVELD